MSETGMEQFAATPETREKNAYVGVCTECGLEDSLAVSNAEELPEVGEIVDDYYCDCDNTTWEVTGYDRLVFQRESRYELGPDITGSEHHYGVIEWKHPTDAEYPRPVCPVRQLGSTDKPRGCWRTATRLTAPDGRGAWSCPWHGTFRIFDYPREKAVEAKQATLFTDGGTDTERGYEWEREGGQGLPPDPSIRRKLESDENLVVHLFTCVNCGRRQASPPGPPASGICGGCGGDYVSHTFEPEEYQRIRWYNDPRPIEGGEP